MNHPNPNRIEFESLRELADYADAARAQLPKESVAVKIRYDNWHGATPSEAEIGRAHV